MEKAEKEVEVKLDTTDTEPSESNKTDLLPLGYSGRSITVFSLGLSSIFLPFVGIVASVIALFQSRKATRELIEYEGKISGFGLIRAGVALAIVGIANFLVSIALIVAATWAINQIPSWIEESITSSTGLGSQILNESIPPINLEELGLTESELGQIESLLPEGSSLDSIDLNTLLEMLNSSGGLEGLSELGLLDSNQDLLELYGNQGTDFDKLIEDLGLTVDSTNP